MIETLLEISMKMKLKILGALFAVALPTLSAQADIRRPVVDSTSFAPGVVGTMMPVAPGLSTTQVQNIVNQSIVQNANTTGSLPAGYREVITTTGNRYLGDGPTGLAAAGYYFALRYPTVVTDTRDAARYAAPNLNDVVSGSGVLIGGVPTVPPTWSVVVVPAAIVDAQGTTTNLPTSYFVVEPVGTRSTLVKNVGAQTLALSTADLATYALANTIGVNTGTASPICNGRGYTNFVPGSITYQDRGNGCDGTQITQWNGAALVRNDACYNQLMTSVTCWK